ncbi:MAG: hypothetical protein WKF58_17045 [Ilumatobacteraceae bacterium]
MTERDCVEAPRWASGCLGPEVVVTGSEVLIAFASIPPRGPSTCPGNPATPVTIDLPAPLGDRRVVDGLELDVEISDYNGSTIGRNECGVDLGLTRRVLGVTVHAAMDSTSTLGEPS